MVNDSKHIVEQLRRPDLSVLGNSIRSLSPGQWHAHMLFSGAPDTELKRLTGAFPATFRQDKTTHPLFVLAAHGSGNLVCPCSSQGQTRQQRFIRKNCRLEMTAQATDKDSFLIERYIFTLPLDAQLCGKLTFRGRVPPACLVDERTTG